MTANTARPLRPEAALGRIAVFRALHLGDLLCASPALRALRAAHPRARITLIGLPWAREFAERFSHYLDDFIAFPGAPGLPERTATPAEHAEFVARARAADFDFVLQLHGSGRHSNAVVASIGARDCAGFHPRGESVPERERFFAYPEGEPEVRRLLRLLEFLGVPLRGDALDFPIAPAEWRAAAGARARFGLQPGYYACVHPGARAATRRWPPERFARVADRLAAKGLRVVVTGTAEEGVLAAAIAKSMHAPCVDLTGQTSVGVLAALLTGAKLLVCNDTGVSHIAAALRVPSVVIYLGSSPERWAPLDHERHRAVFRAVDCRPCEHTVCPIGHPCATGVTHEEVMREVDSLLERRVG
ncbi:MAG: glycosyltransferase family 9 protein [Sulfurifustis sp.]